MPLLLPEGPEHGAEIEHLLDFSFGSARRLKVSYRYRPGIPPVARLCLVAREGGRLVGAIRYWPMLLGAEEVLLLGPLAIDPALRGQGIGRALIRASLAEAEAMGYRLVFLVGDPAYYAQHGFIVVPPSIRIPDEAPGRVQYAPWAVPSYRPRAASCSGPTGAASPACRSSQPRSASPIRGRAL